MITYISKKTGERYPEHGAACWFVPRGWSNSKGKGEHHIKPGYKDCTKGWKKINPKNWTTEEIPDLAKPFTKEQFKEYANKYGLTCAQEFLDTCDYMKEREAFRMFNPSKNFEIWENPENQLWFKSIFKADLFGFMCGTSMAFANTYALDILKFEKYLAYKFNYPMRDDISMHDFMIKEFGQAVVDKFLGLFMPDLALKKTMEKCDKILTETED